LAYFYTAKPVGLKYIALGDITIFLCFGPLLMQATSLVLTGMANTRLNVFSIPLGLLCEGILHANNARDIKEDTAARAVTLAALIGFDLSFLFYVALVVGSYLAVVYIALFLHYGVLLCLLTLPLAIDLVNKFSQKKMLDLAEDTAKMHLPFGLLMFIGIMISSQGLITFLQ